MKRTVILYRIFTGLFALMMLGSSIPDILSSPVAVAGIGRLGYPAYFVPYIGIAKFLGVVAIVLPGFPRLKEWAYAGLCFDLISASYSLIATRQGLGNWAFMILPLGLAAASYIFYQKKLKLQQQSENKYYNRTNFAKPVLQ
ncbi:MAG: DoxX family protein [Flavisolibacter sp.]